MAGPGGSEVERISVKVVPDTDGFHDKVLAFLEKEEKRLDLEIDLKVDTAKAEAELKKLARDLKVKLEVELNAGDVRARLARLARDLTTHVRVEVDDALAKTKLALLTRPRTATVNVDADKGLSRVTGAFGGIEKTAEKAAGSISSALSGAFDGVSQAGSKAVGGISAAFSALGPIITVVVIGAIVLLVGALAGLVVAALAVAGALALALSPALFIGAAVALTFLEKKGNKTAQSLKKNFEAVGKTALNVINKAVQPMLKAIDKQLPELKAWIKTLQGPLTSAFRSASKFVGNFRVGLERLVDNTLDGLVRALKNPQMKQAVLGLEHLMGDLGEGLGRFFEQLATHGADLGAALDSLSAAFVMLAPTFADLLGAFAKVSPQIIDSFAETLNAVMQIFSDPQLLEALATFANFSFTVIAAELVGLAKQIQLVIVVWRKLKEATGEAVQWVKDKWNSFTTWLSQTWDSIKAKASAFGNGVKTAVLNDFNGLKNNLTTIGNGIKTFFSNTWNSITSTVTSKVNSLKSRVTSAWNSLKGATSSVWNGIKNAVSNAVSFIERLVSRIAGAVSRVRGSISDLSPFSLVGPIVDGPSKPMSIPVVPVMTAADFQPRPVKGIWESIGDIQAMGTDINRTAQKFARDNTTSTSTTTPAGGFQKTYNIEINAAPDIPTRDTIIRGLEYTDTLYSH